MKNICTICMRGCSKGVPQKNLRKLRGKPLMAYTIEHALESRLFEHVAISTDSVEITEIARDYGADAWFLRPAELATDKAPKIPVIRHVFLEAEKYYNQRFDVIVDLDVTSPLRKVKDLKAAFQQFQKEDADILLSGCIARKNPYFNIVEKVDGHIRKVKELDKPLVCRQDAPEVYDVNASIYIWKRQALLDNDTLFTDKTSLYVMPEERSVDIDTQLDWDFVEFMFHKQN